MRRWLALGCLLGWLASASAATVPIPAGQAPAAATLLDLDGHEVTLQGLRGRTAVVFYEDREAAEQNRDFKVRLGPLVRARRDRLSVLAVIDVSMHDYWPARGFAKAALRKTASREGVPLACDWKGLWRKRYGLRLGQSTGMILQADGTVAMSWHGALSADESRAILQKVDELSR